MASIFDHLQEEHARLQQSLLRLDHVEPGADRQQRLYQLLCQYTAYARAEESVLYSYLIHVKGIQRPTLQGLDEHVRLAALLRHAERTPPEATCWRATVSSLCEAMKEHLEEEEQNLLSSARWVLSEREAAGLGACFAAECARLRRDFSCIPESAIPANDDPRDPASAT